MKYEDILKKLKGKFVKEILGDSQFRGELTIKVDAAAVDEILKFMKDDKNLSFNFLSDVTAVDFVKDRGVFEVVYHLLSMKNNVRVRFKAEVPAENPELPTATSVFKGANWFERETYDMFGIKFTGHPDLRRIMNPDNFPGHPLRKDFDVAPKDDYCPVPVIKPDN
ncbi:MAG: NADH-quinone oxidoreductase subunit C [Deltaproteobacteria bacterium]|uniref:NADH-quinone oxidoreductase subunit C n=1 Tax=Candidatus Zymogenus saltonus TaxID=2844893 RepID=A0A9D8KD69_9DELT|nr:NADH-quinone oxidoreductase subunit C [Candidatus Zymogenus saltonus]